MGTTARAAFGQSIRRLLSSSQRHLDGQKAMFFLATRQIIISWMDMMVRHELLGREVVMLR